MNNQIVNISLEVLTAGSHWLILRNLLGKNAVRGLWQGTLMVVFLSFQIHMASSMQQFVYKMLLFNVGFFLMALIAFKSSLARAISSGILCYYLTMMGDFFAGFVIVTVLGIPFTMIRESAVLWGVTNLSIIIGAVLLSYVPYVRNTFSKENLTSNNQYLISVVAVGSMVFLALQMHIFNQIPSEYFPVLLKSAVLLQAIMFGFFIFIVSQNNRYWISVNKLFETNIVLEKANNHMHTVEKMLANDRRKNHDLKNALIGLKGLIHEHNKDAMDFLAAIIQNNSEVASKYEMVNFENIRNQVLREILYEKMVYAVEAGTSLKLAVLQPVKALPVELVEFSKVIGSLLDNAIEASQKEGTPVVFGYLEDKEEHIITVSNELKGDIDLSYIFVDGYSTKGEGRGHGLFLIKEIVSKSPNMKLNTKLDEARFIQELLIVKRNVKE